MAELKIVIAEDNPLMMELLSSILEEEDGFVVVGKADNGEDAYQMIMEKGPDLVLLDVICRNWTGFPYWRRFVPLAAARTCRR